MENKFLRLHKSDDNTVIIININDIILINSEIDNNKKITGIFITNYNIDNIYVNESPEKIYQYLLDIYGNSVKFIKLHKSDDNSVIIINNNKISVILTDYDSSINRNISVLYINNDDIDSIYVNESTERIYDLLNINLNNINNLKNNTSKD